MTGRGSIPGWPLITTGVWVVAVVIASATVVTWHDAYARITDAEAQLARLQAEADSVPPPFEPWNGADPITTVVGVSGERMAADTQLLSEIMTLAITWDSAEDYEAAREKLVTDYGVSQDSQFLTTYMAPALYNEDADGRRYHTIDALGVVWVVSGGVDVSVVEASYAAVTYVTIADAEASSRSQRVTGSMDYRTIMIATVTADGRITDISAYTADGVTRG